MPINTRRRRTLARRNPRPPAPDEMRWVLLRNNWTLQPLSDQLDKYSLWMMRNSTNDHDPLLRFKFHEVHNAPDVFIHRSRLQWAGGPFGQLINERTMGTQFDNRLVQLDEEDDPYSFAVLRTAVHMTPVQLEPGMDRMLKLAWAANRWGLWELFQGICFHFQENDMLEDAESLIKVADFTELVDVPSSFVEYFWERVGRKLRSFGFEEGAETECLPIEVQLCPKFPRLWEMAFSQNMVGIVLEYAKLNANVELMERLLEMLLCYMEPKINKDMTFCKLLAQVISPRTAPYCRQIAKEGILDDKCSARAMRLFVLMR